MHLRNDMIFYRELNKKLGSPQLSAPKITTLNVAFEETVL
ncbi:hypothetical protein Godav_028606 [Gossypium davidsonii]|uniref:Uncharacterized protein n=1 Tax=Gossypium davidsonii TaxID=34287 RepID=A0A7J8RZX9_GOSDV|nr:hypothetical protein [Gossypium davidsonii]